MAKNSNHPLHGEVSSLSARANRLLRDPNWYPSNLQEFLNLLQRCGRPWLQNVPIEGLKSRLNENPIGREVATAILDSSVVTVSDLFEAAKFRTNSKARFNRLGSMQQNLLIVTATDYLRSALGVEQADRIETVKQRHKDQRAESLKSIPVQAIAHKIEDARSRNALLRYLPKTYSLYDLTMASDDDLLEIPTLGLRTLRILRQEVQVIADRILEGIPTEEEHEPEIDSQESRYEESDLVNQANQSRILLWSELGYEENLKHEENNVELADYLETLRHKYGNQVVDRLEVTPFRAIAHKIQHTRGRNALLRQLPRGYTLYDLITASDEELLQVRNVGLDTISAIRQEVRGIADDLLAGNLSTAYPVEDIDSPIHSDPTPESAYSNSKPSNLPFFNREFDWQDLCKLVNKYLSERQVEVVRQYFGFYGESKTLEQVGQHINVTRERVRQIKFKAGRRFTKQVLSDEVARAFRGLAASRLEAAGVVVSFTDLLNAPTDPRVVTADERWMLAWFDSLYGSDWYRKVLLAEEPRTDENAQEIATVKSRIAVAQFLQEFSYRPLSQDEALAVAQLHEPSIGAAELRIQLEEDPEIRLFAYGDLQIGHASWRWFDSQRARTARSVEWALRLMNAPAEPAMIAYTMRDRLGITEASAFAVAEVCERESFDFYEQDGRYGLTIWQRTGHLRQSLLELLADGPLFITELADRYAAQNGKVSIPGLITATLHVNPDDFIPVKPLYWARKDIKPAVNYDPTSFTFEDLMPKL